MGAGLRSHQEGGNINGKCAQKLSAAETLGRAAGRVPCGDISKAGLLLCLSLLTHASATSLKPTFRLGISNPSSNASFDLVSSHQAPRSG